MTPTSEQLDAVKLFGSRSTDGARQTLRVNAYAGTGKTSLLKLMAAEAERGRLRGLYLAFNKSIATEAAASFVSSVKCKTTHSLAFAPMMRYFHENNEKMMGAVNAVTVANVLGLRPMAFGGMLRPFSSREMGAIVLNTVRRFCHSAATVIERHHVACDGVMETLDRSTFLAFADTITPHAQRLWNQMADPRGTMPCGHDGYLKVWAISKPRISADYVLLDEAQDSNPVLLSVLANADVQAIYVGDKFQQIYTWRGAVNAMESVDTDNTTYLTQSFRFGENIADFASRIIEHLGAPKPLRGNPAVRDSVRVLRGEQGGYQEKETVAVLCRTNSELIGEYMYLLGKQKTPHIIGGTADVERLLEDADRLQGGEAATSQEFLGFANWGEVSEFVNSQVTKSPLKSFVKLVDDHGPRPLLSAVRRAAQTEAATNYILSTAHKAKGREWERVRLGTDFRVEGEEPGELGSDDELRLFYVACTRAKHALGIPSEYMDALVAAEQLPEVVAEDNAAACTADVGG